MSIEQLVEAARAAYRENAKLVPTIGTWFAIKDDTFQ